MKAKEWNATAKTLRKKANKADKAAAKALVTVVSDSE